MMRIRKYKTVILPIIIMLFLMSCSHEESKMDVPEYYDASIFPVQESPSKDKIKLVPVPFCNEIPLMYIPEGWVESTKNRSIRFDDILYKGNGSYISVYRKDIDEFEFLKPSYTLKGIQKNFKDHLSGEELKRIQERYSKLPLDDNYEMYKRCYSFPLLKDKQGLKMWKLMYDNLFNGDSENARSWRLTLTPPDSSDPVEIFCLYVKDSDINGIFYAVGYKDKKIIFNLTGTIKLNKFSPDDILPALFIGPQ